MFHMLVPLVDTGLAARLQLFIDQLSLANSQFKRKRAARKDLGNVFAIQSQLN